ncbi:MAG: sensor histidine kinase [Sulfurospirillum sp.]|nr:sensor histidine kinase [Sulfurospirillum sp.]
MKLHQHFNKNYFFIFFFTIIVGGFITYFILYNINQNTYENALKKKMMLIALELPHVTDLDVFAKKIEKSTGDRFTIVDADGVVLAEGFGNPKVLENHLNRKEIVQARREGEGFAQRHSTSVDKDLLYFAKSFTLHDKEVYLRLATPLQSVQNSFFNLLVAVSILMLFSMFIGFFITYKLGLKTRQEIKKITNTLDEIANKNYKAIVNASFADEFLLIETHIKKLATKLEKKEKQKRKYTAKIRLISQQRSDIISAISHEFKNPIASIIGYAQTLLDDPSANIHIKERFLEKIVKNSQKISAMIDKMTLATKFENGDLKVNKTQFDLAVLAQEVLSGFQEKYPDRDFIFTVQSALIHADKTMIEMVLINLIDNAIKYSENKIILTSDEHGLHVIDFGIGIAPQELDKVTDKFYRSNSFTWDNSMGLGLALVKYILNLHESKLQIKSELAKGSDFYFQLK